MPLTNSNIDQGIAQVIYSITWIRAHTHLYEKLTHDMFKPQQIDFQTHSSLKRWIDYNCKCEGHTLIKSSRFEFEWYIYFTLFSAGI